MKKYYTEEELSKKLQSTIDAFQKNAKIRSGRIGSWGSVRTYTTGITRHPNPI